MANKALYSQEVYAEGHLVDSGVMSTILDLIIRSGGQFNIKSFEMGHTNVDKTRTTIEISASTPMLLEHIISQLHLHGCMIKEDVAVSLKPAPRNSVAPDDFYSTTNHTTEIRLNGGWHRVRNQRMDAVIMMDNGKPRCVKIRDLQKGMPVVTGISGIRVIPEFKERNRSVFEFMSGDVSSEKKVELAVGEVAAMLESKKYRTVIVAGPVVVHTGGSDSLCYLIENDCVQGLLSGNALAVHDIEQALYGTSLGINTKTGRPVEEGHKNHMRAINEVFKYGNIKNMIAKNALTSGIMFTLCRKRIPFVLAGSLRDDGPLPETINDMVEAQAAYARILRKADMVIMLSTMLHSIATGNMLPSKVRTICVDINPSVVTKLADRGSAQAVGIVTDVGLFLNLLARKLRR
ncbi:MAG: TIGR00300 family protein [Candidatus Zixiibacteriota bacterium]|nr:MAG: TIGR00300 family protein [candidate division Zixibacteria bacterium]